jgi:hypothetical protein
MRSRHLRAPCASSAGCRSRQGGAGEPGSARMHARTLRGKPRSTRRCWQHEKHEHDLAPGARSRWQSNCGSGHGSVRGSAAKRGRTTRRRWLRNGPSWLSASRARSAGSLSRPAGAQVRSIALRSASVVVGAALARKQATAHGNTTASICTVSPRSSSTRSWQPRTGSAPSAALRSGVAGARARTWITPMKPGACAASCATSVTGGLACLVMTRPGCVQLQRTWKPVGQLVPWPRASAQLPSCPSLCSLPTKFCRVCAD